ncbi:MAG: helix-turn-helix transcriptional regulator [Spirosoma sp.]|nr:helix-turn-helix transcriptional regulator [Spirosoma sp.]
MNFFFSAYSMPLLFGFVQAWVYALLLWIRGRREERLSDRLLGWVLVGLAFEIWIYMLGFGGIEIFWQRLEFFPRTLTLLLPPLIYFYLRAQFDTGFGFQPRDAWHFVPFVADTLYHVVVFAMGPAFVQYWEVSVHNLGINHLEYFGAETQQFLYLYWSFQLYQSYRAWTKTQFSDTESISFRWYRNFLIALFITMVTNLLVTLIDLWLNLDFWHDWWGNLVTVVFIYYVSIEGYAQQQTANKLHFNPNSPITGSIEEQPQTLVTIGTGVGEPVPVIDTNLAKATLPDLPERLAHLLTYMTNEKPHLDADLSLTDLARRLHTNSVILSQVINTGTGQNFNDFVNRYRVDEFKQQIRDPANAHLSFLGLALDCGFNSKATFNRAFKKFTGGSPKEFAGNA